MIYIGLPTIVSVNELSNCISSISLCDFDKKVGIVWNGEDRAVGQVIGSVKDELDFLRCCPQNVGCAESWNILCDWAFGEGAEEIVICNDDIFIGKPSAVPRLVEAAHKTGFAFDTEVSFSFFCLPKATWLKVGRFDNNFWPAYYEDNDYYVRLELAGITVSVVDCQIITERSQSIKNSEELRITNSMTFPRNQLRYIAKWGGLPHNEAYEIPFNGCDDPYGSTEVAYRSGHV